MPADVLVQLTSINLSVTSLGISDDRGSFGRRETLEQCPVFLVFGGHRFDCRSRIRSFRGLSGGVLRGRRLAVSIKGVSVHFRILTPSGICAYIYQLVARGHDGSVVVRVRRSN